jgi:hypothetical protein
MIAAPIKLNTWIEHRSDGDFAICFCPQSEGREHLAYTACWNDADPEDYGSLDFGTGASVDEAIDALKEPFRREYRA